MKVLITGANGQLGGALQRTAPAHADLNAIDVDDVDARPTFGVLQVIYRAKQVRRQPIHAFAKMN